MTKKTMTTGLIVAGALALLIGGGIIFSKTVKAQAGRDLVEPVVAQQQVNSTNCPKVTGGDCPKQNNNGECPKANGRSCPKQNAEGECPKKTSGQTSCPKAVSGECPKATGQTSSCGCGK